MLPGTESVDVLLFAIARDLVGSEQVQVQVNQPITAGELKRALATQYPALSQCLEISRLVAANRYLTDDQQVPPSAELALIPPVSGG